MAELSSSAQHDTDAAFAAQPDFPGWGSSHAEQSNFWNLLSNPQLAAICTRQDLGSYDDKQGLITRFIERSNFMLPVTRVSRGRQEDAHAAAAIVDHASLPSPGKSVATVRNL